MLSLIIDWNVFIICKIRTFGQTYGRNTHQMLSLRSNIWVKVARSLLAVGEHLQKSYSDTQKCSLMWWKSPSDKQPVTMSRSNVATSVHSSDLFSGGDQFESWPGYWLSWPSFQCFSEYLQIRLRQFRFTSFLVYYSLSSS